MPHVASLAGHISHITDIDLGVFKILLVAHHNMRLCNLKTATT